MASFSDSSYWRERLNTITNLFNDERYHECIAELDLILKYIELPPLYRIHAHALYAAALDDGYDAEDERARAESVYADTRTNWRPGENEKTDELLDKARKTLDDLAADMLADRSDDWQEHKADLMERDIESIATAEQDLLEKDDDTNAEAAEPGRDGR